MIASRHSCWSFFCSNLIVRHDFPFSQSMINPRTSVSDGTRGTGGTDLLKLMIFQDMAFAKTDPPGAFLLVGRVGHPLRY
jgi:hypothetical protein